MKFFIYNIIIGVLVLVGVVTFYTFFENENNVQANDNNFSSMDFSVVFPDTSDFDNFHDDTIENDLYHNIQSTEFAEISHWDTNNDIEIINPKETTKQDIISLNANLDTQNLAMDKNLLGLWSNDDEIILFSSDNMLLIINREDEMLNTLKYYGVNKLGQLRLQTPNTVEYFEYTISGDKLFLENTFYDTVSIFSRLISGEDLLYLNTSDSEDTNTIIAYARAVANQLNISNSLAIGGVRGDGYINNNNINEIVNTRNGRINWTLAANNSSNRTSNPFNISLSDNEISEKVMDALSYINGIWIVNVSNLKENS
ncbi:MAG: hypothetical protein FWF57_04535 [Defluviitaleaceae bacterium]|nr:hypothetical protein [Defluviitaleaceae bacterium]